MQTKSDNISEFEMAMEDIHIGDRYQSHTNGDYIYEVISIDYQSKTCTIREAFNSPSRSNNKTILTFTKFRFNSLRTLHTKL